MIIVCLTCNITLPRRRGSRPDGARYYCNLVITKSHNALLKGVLHVGMVIFN